mgnify:CR=1 FL=1
MRVAIAQYAGRLTDSSGEVRLESSVIDFFDKSLGTGSLLSDESPSSVVHSLCDCDRSFIYLALNTGCMGPLRPQVSGVISLEDVQKPDLVALVGLGVLVLPYVRIPQINRYLSEFNPPMNSPELFLLFMTFLLPVLPSIVVGYATRSNPAGQTGVRQYFHGLSRYIAIGVAPSMVPGGFIASGYLIGWGGQPSISSYVMAYTVSGLLIAGIATFGAVLGYTTGYMTGRLRSTSQ